MPGPFTLDELARRTGGRIEGDGTVLISRTGTLKSADASAIAFFANTHPMLIVGNNSFLNF